MEKNITFLSAESLRTIQQKRQLDFVYQKILEAVKNLRKTCYISTDFKLEIETVEYLKDMGYTIKIDYKSNKIPYLYSYEIGW